MEEFELELVEEPIVAIPEGLGPRGAFLRGFGFGWCAAAGVPVAMYLLGGYGVGLLPLIAFVSVGFAVSLWGSRSETMSPAARRSS